MPFCPTGQHPQEKSGYGVTASMSVAAIAGLLTNIPASWAVPLAAYIGAVSFTLNDLCSNDPPAVPTISAADVADLLGGPLNPFAFVPALQKFQQLVAAYAWFTFCECSGGTTPAAPAAPGAPSGMPTIDTGPVNNTPCGSYTGFNASNPQQFSTSGSSNAAGIADVVGNGVTSAKISWHTVAQTNGGFAMANMQLQFRNPSAFLGPVTTIGLPNGGTATTILAVPSGATLLTLQWTGPGGSPAKIELVDWVVDYFCGATLGTPGECCTDPRVLAVLNQILEYVTLIQRQAVPFAHVLGTVHAGVSGQGTFTVAGLLGVKLELTTIPTSYGSAVAQPTYHFDMGWLSVLTPDGLIDERRITAQSTSWLPPFMSDATVVGYSLNPGVVGTITELEREP